MTETMKKLSDGVVGLLMPRRDTGLYQEALFVRDANDRGTGTGICKIGLPAGCVEPGETIWDAFLREMHEEAGCENIKANKWGVFTKDRSGGYNENHLFASFMKLPEDLKTNDKQEVSHIEVFSFGEIFNMYELGHVHEGTARLLVHYLNGHKRGSLSTPVSYARHIHI